MAVQIILSQMLYVVRPFIATLLKQHVVVGRHDGMKIQPDHGGDRMPKGKTFSV